MADEFQNSDQHKGSCKRKWVIVSISIIFLFFLLIVCLSVFILSLGSQASEQLSTVMPEIPLDLQVPPETVPKIEDRIGELAIAYPSYLRPRSSERTDLTIHIPPNLASIQPTDLERLPSTITPTLKTLDHYTTHILVSEQMAAVLSSPTFSIEPIYPTQQRIDLDGDKTHWSWNITAPDSLSTGLLTLKVYKLYQENVDLDNLAPTWVGTIQVDVIQYTPTPQKLPMIAPTPSITQRIVDEPVSFIGIILIFIVGTAGVLIAYLTYKQNQQKKAALAAAGSPEASTPSTLDTTEQIQLFHLLDQHYSDQELRTLCFELSVDYDDLPYPGQANKARELVALLARNGRLGELTTQIQRDRPTLFPLDDSGDDE